MVKQKRLIQQFIDLVKIDSETKNEAAIAAYLRKKFNELGLNVVEDEARELSGHGANNLICTLPGTINAQPCIFFSAHMDTVTPGKKITPIVTESHIQSDGTTILGADDKAGIAAILEVIQLLKEQNIAHGDIQFIITVGEESGLAGAKALDRQLIKATTGYVLDSDGPVGTIVTEAPYQEKFHIQFYGKKAHAGIAPEKGISAISVASKAIASMKLGRIDHETTANISFFQGGKKDETNIVTDSVYVEGEARSLQKAKLDQVITQLKRAATESATTCGATANFFSELIYPGFRIEEDHPVVQTAMKAAQNIGLSAQTVQSGGGSDANIFNQLGFPTVNLAIGYEYIHTKKERIAIDSLVKTTELALEIIRETYK